MSLSIGPYSLMIPLESIEKMLDSSGEKKYSDDIEAHLAALEQLGKDYGIWYETR